MREHGSDVGKVKRYMPPGNAKKAGWRHFYVTGHPEEIAGDDDTKRKVRNRRYRRRVSRLLECMLPKKGPGSIEYSMKSFTTSGISVTVNGKEDKNERDHI